jgi:hypothetical protein
MTLRAFQDVDVAVVVDTAEMLVLVVVVVVVDAVVVSLVEPIVFHGMII